jgi:photosynthetic reaction center cytochrome c subunit
MRLLYAALIAVSLFAQAPEGQKKGPPTPKNLKILKPEEIRPTMAAFRTALGVQCNFCHIQGDFASDDNPNKLTARRMMTMTHDLNASTFEGKMRVTCYTCHRGATEPPSAPPAAGQ